MHPSFYPQASIYLNTYRMRFVSILLFSLCCCFSGVKGQDVILQGNAEQFAGESLLIRKVTNPITGESSIIDTLLINKNGDFKKRLTLITEEWVFINSGIFRLSLFLQPGKGYYLILPPKTTKSEADIRNPFFKPVIASLRVRKEYSIKDLSTTEPGEDINSKLFRFDTLILAGNREMMEARRNLLQVNSDSIIEKIESNFKGDTSSFFRNYRNYRYGIVKINSRDAGLEHIYDSYLKAGKPATNNPAYMELFNVMYEEFLFYYSRTKEGESINYLVNRTQDLAALEDTLMKHPAIPDRRMAELIVIKEIFDIYFKDYFYREALLILLDSVAANPVLPEYAVYAMGVKKYLTRLKTGETPPPFSLLDQKNKPRSLDDYKGKYIYLNFCTPDNYSCLKEFPFLDVLYKAHKDYLEILTIMVTEDYENMTDFMKKNRYDWPALFYGNNDELLRDYDVRAYPTSYLLDPEGKIIQSPATLATEGFEQQLFRIMRSRGDL